MNENYLKVSIKFDEVLVAQKSREVSVSNLFHTTLPISGHFLVSFLYLCAAGRTRDTKYLVRIFIGIQRLSRRCEMTPKQAKPQKVPPKQHTAIFTCTSWSYKRQMTKLMKETLASKVSINSSNGGIR
ncbi:hypothetical protein P5673_021530 [Acropora cervicornis]|uniref:Uncharacterized protein n=1 Tax=Acropora cervicornis TaxID=6130 RepID=A0AAD9V0F8_ACRCE|nr:hypothetical protein P5673_021530 [Acropora cervicornis]